MKNKILIAFFVFIITVPGLVRILRLDLQDSSQENRRLSVRPTLTWHKLQSFPQEYQKYYEDSFAFRQNLIQAKNYLSVVILKSSPRTSIILGRNGWLFYNNKGPTKIEQPFTGDELKTIKANLEKVHQSLKAQGIQFYLFIAPDAQAIYPENLPFYLPPPSPSQFSQLVGYLNDSPVQVIDPQKALFASKVVHRSYRLYDTHWNDFGAYIGYKELIDRVGQDFPAVRSKPLTEFTIEYKKSPNTDLLGIVALTGVFNEQVPVLSPHKKRAVETIISCRYKPNCEKIRTNVDDEKLPQLLMYRDSFSNKLFPFIAEHFREAYYMWTTKISQKDIDEVKPDIVIFQTVGRDIEVLKNIYIK